MAVRASSEDSCVSKRPFLFKSLIAVAAIAVAGCSGGTSSVPAIRTASADASPSEPIAQASSMADLTDAVESDTRSSRAVTETPLAADALADSVGLNGGTRSETSAAQWTIIQNDLKILGIRHLRAPIEYYNSAYEAQIVKFLTAMNGKLDGITDCPGIEYDPDSATSPKDIQDFDAAIGDRLEAVEGPNEVDNRNDADWAADTLNCLPNLRRAEPNLPFIAPSLVDQFHNAPKLGDISYFSGYNPGSPGWGGGGSACGIYGSLAYGLCESAVNSGSKAVMITESGYNSKSEVDEPTQAKYLSRMFLVNLKGGVPRTYIYTFTDFTPGDGFGSNGLLRVDLSRKPSFEAIAREVAYFNDPGTPVDLKPLTYTIGGDTKTSDHLLFQRRDGTYILALWDETASWDVEKKHEVKVRPRTLTVDFEFSPHMAKGVSMNDKGVLVDTKIETSTGKIALPVDDHVTFLSFRAE
jgi:hypothetical protein